MGDDKTIEERPPDVFVGDMIKWKEGEFSYTPSDYKVKHYVGIVVEVKVPEATVQDIMWNIYYSHSYDPLVDEYYRKNFWDQRYEEVPWIKVLTIQGKTGKKVFRYLSMEDEFEVLSRASLLILPTTEKEHEE